MSARKNIYLVAWYNCFGNIIDTGGFHSKEIALLHIYDAKQGNLTCDYTERTPRLLQIDRIIPRRLDDNLLPELHPLTYDEQPIRAISDEEANSIRHKNAGRTYL